MHKIYRFILILWRKISLVFLKKKGLISKSVQWWHTVEWKNKERKCIWTPQEFLQRTTFSWQWKRERGERSLAIIPWVSLKGERHRQQRVDCQRGDHSLAVDLELGVLMPLSAFHAGIYFPSTNRIANVVCMYVYFWAWLCKKYLLRKEQQSLLHRVHSSQAFLAFSSLANEVPCHTVCRACVLCREECSVSQGYLIW